MFPYSTYLSLRKQRQGSQKEAVQNKGGLCYSSHQGKKNKKPSSKQYNNVFICLSLLYSPVVTFASPKEKKQVIVV